MADVVQKLPKFCYRGNKDRPPENPNGSIKSAVSENPMFGAKSAAVVFVQAELCPISCENSPKFVTMATRVSPGKI